MTNTLQDLKKTNNEYYHSLWKMAQAGELDSLSEEDQLLAGIIDGT
jgi:hypothetical protein